MKKTRYLALLLAAAFALSGCNIVKVNPERDGLQIVAEVNGEKITKAQVYDEAGITWDQKVETWDLEEHQQKKEDALENMIEEIVIRQKAVELGYYNFTDDEKKQIDDALASFIQTTYDEALADYKEQAETDSSINPEEKANEKADAYLAQYGYTRESYRKLQEDNIAYGKAQKAVTDPVVPTDSDVQAAYDEMLTEQKTEFDADPSQIAMLEMYYGYPILYYPVEGFVRVKHILVKLPDEVQQQISNLRKEEKTDEADKLRDDELAKILGKTNEALAKAKEAGGDLAKLEQLLGEYGEDPGMTGDSPGYLVYPESKDWVQGFTDAAMALKDLGKPTEPVATDYGYHILWLTEKIEKGDVPLDKVREKVMEIVKGSQQNDAWQETVAGWMEEYKPKIRRFVNRLHN